MKNELFLREFSGEEAGDLHNPPPPPPPPKTAGAACRGTGRGAVKGDAGPRQHRGGLSLPGQTTRRAFMLANSPPAPTPPQPPPYLHSQTLTHTLVSPERAHTHNGHSQRNQCATVRCNSTAVSSRKMDDVDDVLVPSHINLITSLDEFFFSRSVFFSSKCKAPSTVCLSGTQKSLPVGKKRCHTHVYSNNIPFRTPRSFSLFGPRTVLILRREDAQRCRLKKHTLLQERRTSRCSNICSIFWQLISGRKTHPRKGIQMLQLPTLKLGCL